MLSEGGSKGYQRYRVAGGDLLDTRESHGVSILTGGEGLVLVSGSTAPLALAGAPCLGFGHAKVSTKGYFCGKISD